jgi:DNA-binding NarL/FixJ family response regulator
MERLQPKVIRVVVADDHPVAREGTQSCLQRCPDIDVVGVAETGAGALKLVQELQPDVLVLDVRFPDRNGVEVARVIRRQFPSVAILLLTGYPSLGYDRELLVQCVHGLLSKSSPSDQIVAAVRAASASAQRLQPLGPLLDLAADALTSREEEILELMNAGNRNAEIASSLGLSVKTVEYHVSHILGKLRARSRTEALVKANTLWSAT